jgi:hypothetical protein
MGRPLDIHTAQAPEGLARLPVEAPPLFDLPVPPPSPWFAGDVEDDDHESVLSPLIPVAKEHTVWRKRMNQALKIHVDRYVSYLLSAFLHL